MTYERHWGVIDYVAEEVRRQGHDIAVLDGIERVGWMLDAWSYAIQESNRGNKLVRPMQPVFVDIIRIGKRIEREKNDGGLRRVGVRVGTRICPHPSEVEPRLKRLFEHGSQLAPLEFYRELLEIHPFVDGNGRTGKVVLNWLNGTLHSPIFPPSDFWGQTIRNP